MMNWRTRALLGASTAAVLVALVPFPGVRNTEREVVSRLAGGPAGVSRVTHRLATGMGAVETRAQDMATLVRRGIGDAARGGAEAPASDGSPAEPAAFTPQVPSETASTEILPPDAASQSEFAAASCPSLSGGAGLPEGRCRSARGARGCGQRSGRASGARVGGLARRSASDLRGARGLQQGPPDLAGAELRALPARGRPPGSSPVRLRCGGVLRRGAAAVERRQARRRPRRGGGGAGG